MKLLHEKISLRNQITEKVNLQTKAYFTHAYARILIKLK